MVDHGEERRSPFSDADFGPGWAGTRSPRRRIRLPRASM